MQMERVLGRTIARELNAEEVEHVGGGAGALCDNGSVTPCTCRADGGDDYCCDA